MSEEEIIKYTKNIINATYIEATEQDEDGNIIEQGLVNQQVIQGLLDLYNKEKEKNKELHEKLIDLDEHYSRLYKFHNRNCVIKDDYISKDEIKELIKFYEKEIKEDGVLTKLNNYDLLRAVINEVQDLLEEDNK